MAPRKDSIQSKKRSGIAKQTESNTGNDEEAANGDHQRDKSIFSTIARIAVTLIQLSSTVVQAFSSFITVVLTVGLVIYTYLQWDATDNQYAAMLEQNKLTERATKATEEAVKISRDELKASKESMEATNESTRNAVELVATLAKAAVDANKIARETAERDLRAHVTVLAVAVIPVESPPHLQVRISLMNNGAIRANDVDLAIKCRLEKADYRGPFDDAIGQRQKSFIGPSFSANRFIPVQVTESELKAFNTGELVLWIYGKLTYSDDFSDDRYHQYRWSYDGRQTAGAGFFLEPNDGEGNEAN